MIECINYMIFLVIVIWKPANFGKAGYQLEIRSRGKFQKSVSKVESKLDIENPKSCSGEARIQDQFEVARILTFIHEYWIMKVPIFPKLQ